MTQEITTRYWQTEARWYRVDAHQDLLGDWVVMRIWGGRFNKRGNKKIDIARNKAAAFTLIKKIEVVRKRRGYEQCGAYSIKFSYQK